MKTKIKITKLIFLNRNRKDKLYHKSEKISLKGDVEFQLSEEDYDKVDWKEFHNSEIEIDIPEINELEKYSDEEISKEYLKRNNKFVFCPYCKNPIFNDENKSIKYISSVYYCNYCKSNVVPAEITRG